MGQTSSQDILQPLWDMVMAGDASLQAIGTMSLEQYLQDAATQKQVTVELIKLCQALMLLERQTPGLACCLSYRQRMAAFYRYLVGDPAELKQDYVYAILRSQIPLLVLEARELLRLQVD